MKILNILSILMLCLCLSGYTQCQTMSDEYILRELKRREPTQITLQASYSEVFKATINVFQDFNINILRKNYEDKLILGTCYYEVPMRIGIYGAFFKEGGRNRIEIIIKVQGGWFSANYILNKIKEEVELQKKLTP